MNGWSTFWLGLIVVSLSSFALLAVYVTVDGARDVVAMFRRIDRQHKQAAEDSDSP